MESLPEVKAWTKEWPGTLVGPAQMAETLGISEARLIEFADAKIVPHYRVDNGGPLFKSAEVKRWAAENLLERFDGQTLPIEFKVVMDPGPNATTRPPDGLIGLAHMLREIHAHALKGPSGVYFLCHGSELVYIGQSTNPPIRIASHTDKEFDRAYWIPIPLNELNEVEGALIRYFKPKLNGGAERKGKHLAAPQCRNPDKVLSDLGLAATKN